MKVIQVVGYKNSGKTTLTSTMIRYFREKGVRVASLKHHGHGGVPEGLDHTDSAKHKQAGAFIAGVEGDGVFQLVKDHWTLDEMIKIYDMMNLDLTIVEGYKAYPYPKVVLIRKEEDLDLLEELEGVLAMMSRIPLEETSYGYPVFSPTEMTKLCKWLQEKIN